MIFSGRSLKYPRGQVPGKMIRNWLQKGRWPQFTWSFHHSKSQLSPGGLYPLLSHTQNACSSITSFAPTRYRSLFLGPVEHPSLWYPHCCSAALSMLANRSWLHATILSRVHTNTERWKRTATLSETHNAHNTQGTWRRLVLLSVVRKTMIYLHWKVHATCTSSVLS